MSSDTKEKSLIDTFFDAADAVVGGVERAVSPKDSLWKIEDILDEKGSTYRITDGESALETTNIQLAERVRDCLNG